MEIQNQNQLSLICSKCGANMPKKSGVTFTTNYFFCNNHYHYAKNVVFHYCTRALKLIDTQADNCCQNDTNYSDVLRGLHYCDHNSTIFVKLLDGGSYQCSFCLATVQPSDKLLKEISNRDRKLVKVYLEYDNGTAQIMRGKKAEEWMQIIDGPFVTAQIRSGKLIDIPQFESIEPKDI